MWSRRGPRNGKRRLPESQRRRILRAYPNCVLGIVGVCVGISTEVHHVVEAADGGRDDDDNLVGVCSPCHRYVSARDSQRRSVKRQNEWKRQPERRPRRPD